MVPALTASMKELNDIAQGVVYPILHPIRASCDYVRSCWHKFVRFFRLK